MAGEFPPNKNKSPNHLKQKNKTNHLTKFGLPSVVPSSHQKQHPVPMHRTRGHVATRRHQRTSSAAASRPDGGARVAGVRHSPRFLTAAAAAPSTGSKMASLASSPLESEDGGEESQDLLSPPRPFGVGPSEQCPPTFAIGRRRSNVSTVT